MLVRTQPTYLLASHEPALLADFEPVLLDLGARVEFVLSAQAALTALRAPREPKLVIIDQNLPGMGTEQLLAAVREESGSRRFPIALITDSVTHEWLTRVAEGVIDDVFPRTAQPLYWRLRIESALRAFDRERELDRQREAAALSAQTDPLTGIYNRTTILSMLFRETDRVQRMSSSLSMILFDIDDFRHWNSRLGTIACDDLLLQVVARVGRLLRSYDLFGRVGKDEFLVALPGCSSVNAALLAERVRQDVFTAPFHLPDTAVRLSACFGIASSGGRSPMVVLRDAEDSLRQAKSAGPESIQCAGESPRPEAPPAAFTSPTSGDDLLAW